MRIPGVPGQLGVPTPIQLVNAASNVVTRVRTGHLADLRPMPSRLIDAGRTRDVYCYDPAPGFPPAGAAVLLVPPLAAPALAYDLRRGCSLVEYLVRAGLRTYLVDYGPIALRDRARGLEHWVDDVIPHAVEAVAADTNEPVLLVSWSIAGALCLLTQAAHPELPIAGIAVVATPFDVSQVPLVAPLRPLVRLTGGRVGTAAYRLLGIAPAPLVQRAFRLTSVDKEVLKPMAVMLNLDDREFLAQIEAVDRFMAGMLAYPGRTFGQLYHRFFRRNELARGGFDLPDRRVELGDVTVPVLAVAGEGDSIAPVAAVHHVGTLLTGSPEVRLVTGPGGHLGVLTGRGARTTTWPRLQEFLRDHGAGAAVH